MLYSGGLAAVHSKGRSREAIWQAILSRGDVSTYRLIDSLADHGRLGRLLTEERFGAVAAALREVEGTPPWRFISSAPTRARAAG